MGRRMTWLIRAVPLLFFKLGFFTIWRCIPSAIRKHIVRTLVALPSRKQRLLRPVDPVILVGLLLSTTSFGWLARLNAALLRSASLRVYELDISAAFSASHLPNTRPEIPGDVTEGAATLLISLNPHQLAYTSAFMPAKLFERKYVIAYCAWELERIPNNWKNPIETFDEIWVPSSFVQRAFTETVSIPCRVVPPDLVCPSSLQPNRSLFGIPPRAFAILVVLSLRSGLSRKNPFAAVRAFFRAFPNNFGVRLILKISDTDIESVAWTTLRTTIGSDPRIIFITDSLLDAEMWNLIASVDVVLSTHRSEGFGMIPAQAMLCNRAVVATGWSGNLDFMDSDCSILLPYTLVPVKDPDGIYPENGHHWAEVDENATTDALRRLYFDLSFRESLSLRGQERARVYFSHYREQNLKYLKEWSRTGHKYESKRAKCL
jgi:glycosyltransferase involved in cell wall biosynthesis